MTTSTASASHAPPAADRPTAPPRLAPCIAVVGPANSGKTTLLHLLDEALQLHPEAPLVYVVKGNPDGTGRYLFHAPALREPLKLRVKGAWTSVTVETIAEWIDHCRERLELVLVDVGGRHSESNRILFSHCSHCLVLARAFEEEATERAQGLASWARAGCDAGLSVLARVRSLWQEGEPAAGRGEDGALEAAFRADAAEPGDTLNRPVVERLTEELLHLRTRREHPTYLDLRLPRAWTFADLPDLAGLAGDLHRAATSGSVVLGGRAPIWAYAAALHRTLDLDPAAAVEVYDPKAPHGLVAVPASLAGQAPDQAAKALSTRWAEAPDGVGAALELEITTPDRFLPAGFVQHLPALPRPDGPPPPGPVMVSGAGPIWLHLAYSRWLRSLPGDRPIGHVDAGTGCAIQVTGPGAPATRPWRLA
jgi:hypothetical protein